MMLLRVPFHFNGLVELRGDFIKPKYEGVILCIVGFLFSPRHFDYHDGSAFL